MHDQEGAPVPGATFEFKLNRQEVYEGFVVPTRVLATAGEDGTCTVALWPNQLGSAESSYQVTIRSPGGKSERVLATIPNVATVNLHDVSALPPYPGKPDAQVYLETAQGIVADAQEAAANASNSAAQASTKAGEALTSANSAGTERAAAQAARTGAEAAQAAAAASAGTAAAAAGAAASSASAAANSLTDINTGLSSKASLSGANFTGHIEVPPDATGNQVPRASQVAKLGTANSFSGLQAAETTGAVGLASVTPSHQFEARNMGVGAAAMRLHRNALYALFFGLDTDNQLAIGGGSMGALRRRIYHEGNILGVAAQASGVPTGALLEYGANANGEYLRFADGTQICRKNFSVPATGTTPWTYPAVFASQATISALLAGTLGYCYVTDGGNGTYVTVNAIGSAGTRVAANANLTAIGRWF